MKRQIVATCAVLTTLLGSAASAAEHLIYVQREGYFPSITYLDSGDTLKFVNNTGYGVKIRKNNGYTLSPYIANGSSYTISVSNFLYYNSNSGDIKPAYFSSNGGYSYWYYFDPYNQYEAQISFAQAPNG